MKAFAKKKILKNKKHKEKKYIATNKFSEREREKDGDLHKITRKKKKGLSASRFITATTSTGIPLPLPPPPQNQGYLDLVYINSQATFPNTTQDFESD